MSDRVAVKPEDEFEVGNREIIDADGVSIGVFNVEGEYFAIRNQCLHDCGPVCEGRVQRLLTGEFVGPGERVTEKFDGKHAIACPWHGWEYYLESGEHVADDDYTLPTYDVTVHDGVVCVEI